MSTLLQASKWRTLLTKLFIVATLMLLAFSTVSTISESESRLFPEGTSIHEGFPWRNGDHMYYVSSALQIAGIPYEQALRETTNEFSDWPGEPTDLNAGYLDMDFSPLVYSRFSFPFLLSWGYQAIGFLGMFTIPLLLFSLTTGFLIYWVRKTFGLLPAIGALFSCASSVLFVKYGSGLFIESIVFLIEVSWLFLLPIIPPAKVSIQKIVLFNLSVVLLAVTRQMPFLPIFVLLAGFLATTMIQKTWRNAWLPFLASGSITTAAMYVLVSIWAPYDPIPYLTTVYGAPAGLGFIPWALNHLLDALIVTAASLGIKDPAMFVLIPLGLLGGWHLRRMTITWVAVGAWLASSSTLALNFPEYRFWAPGIVFSIPLIGYGAGIVMGSACRWLSAVNELSIESRPIVNNWSMSKKALNAFLIIFVTFSLIVGTSLVARYNTEDQVLYSEPSSTYGWTDEEKQPMTGIFQCRGDDSQLSYLSEEKQLFPMTGSSKANVFVAPKFIAYDSTGKKITYTDLMPLVSKCLSSNTIPNN
jgi:hypothetical protein